MKKIVLIIAIAILSCYLTSCSKIALGETVTYWADSSWCLELDGNTNTAYLYVNLHQTGIWSIYSASKYVVAMDQITFSPDLKVERYAKETDISIGVFNESKTELVLETTGFQLRLIKTNIHPNMSKD